MKEAHRLKKNFVKPAWTASAKLLNRVILLFSEAYRYSTLYMHIAQRRIVLA